MPKAPNLKNPVASLRHRLGMKMDEFADYIGHGAAMLRHVEAGRKPVGRDLARKIYIKTRMPIGEFGGELTGGRSEGLATTSGTLAAPYPKHGGDIVPVEFLAEVLGFYFALLESGINPNLGYIAIQREIAVVTSRWGLPRSRCETVRNEFMRFLSEDVADAEPRIAALNKILSGSGPFQRAREESVPRPKRKRGALNLGKAGPHGKHPQS